MIEQLKNIKGRETFFSLRPLFFHMISKTTPRLFFILLFSFLLKAINLLGQDTLALPTLINQIQRGKNDSIRAMANVEFQSRIVDSLRTQNSFDKNFQEFKNVSVVTSDDKLFKIVSWTYPNFNGDKYYYFGFIQYRKKLSDSIQLFTLIDSTQTISKPESEKLKSNRWLGSVYYAINTIKYQGKYYYVLLGWKGFNQQQTKKVIEVCYIENNEVKFGFPLLKIGSVYKNRIVFIFTSQATMSLKFEKKGKKIVFDHISSPKNKSDVEVMSQTGPDGTYDSFILTKGRYILEKDVDARSETTPGIPVPDPSNEIKQIDKE